MIMKRIINLLMIIPLLTVAIILLNGCTRERENIIVGTWQICGMSVGFEDPVCADEQGDTITFQSNGLIKDKKGLYNEKPYQLLNDTSLFIGTPGREYKIKFYNNDNNMIIYDWVYGSPNVAVSVVYNINLKRIRQL